MDGNASFHTEFGKLVAALPGDVLELGFAFPGAISTGGGEVNDNILGPNILSVSKGLGDHLEGAISAVFIHIAEERPGGGIGIPVGLDQWGMDASGQAKNIISSGLQIPGFRKDERILESILNRYIMPLTVMGGIAIGLLAAAANVVGALVGGTALLLGIMITFQFYQNIAQQHAMDMNPALKKMMGV